MTSPLSPPLDLDQVAAVLAGLRPGWREQGLVVRPFLWRDARGSWPQILHTDRGKVAEPESVGLTLTAADGREARLVIWRGGWADVDLLAGGTVTTRTPGVRDLAGCAALAAWMIGELTARRPERGDDWVDLRPVTHRVGYRLVGRPGRGHGHLPGPRLLVPGHLRHRRRRVDLTAAMLPLRTHPRRTAAPVGPAPPVGVARRRQLLLPP